MEKYNKYVQEVSENELLEAFNYEDRNILDLKMLDSNVHFDKNLSSLIDYLDDYGLTDNEILPMLENNMYGEYMELYYIADIDMHMMIIGIR